MTPRLARDVIVPLGARWHVYDEALQRTWVGAEAQLVRDAAEVVAAGLGHDELRERTTELADDGAIR